MFFSYYDNKQCTGLPTYVYEYGKGVCYETTKGVYTVTFDSPWILSSPTTSPVVSPVGVPVASPVASPVVVRSVAPVASPVASPVLGSSLNGYYVVAFFSDTACTTLSFSIAFSLNTCIEDSNGLTSTIYTSTATEYVESEYVGSLCSGTPLQKRGTYSGTCDFTKKTFYSSTSIVPSTVLTASLRCEYVMYLHPFSFSFSPSLSFLLSHPSVFSRSLSLSLFTSLLFRDISHIVALTYF
jgi:hypothetical protein